MSGQDFYLYIDGKPVKVSEEVYREYYRAEEKERYFMTRLKQERIVIDQETQTVTIIPSREDSYERLIEANEQFATSDKSVAETVVKAIQLEKLNEALHTLSDEEMTLIRELFYLNRTVREVSEQYQIARSTLQSRKEAVLRKLWNLLERFF